MTDTSINTHIKTLSFSKLFKCTDLGNNKTFIPFAGCVLEHILLENKLSPKERLYYILAYGNSIINANYGKESNVTFSSNCWADYLDSSRSSVFLMQKKLQATGYFNIQHAVNYKGFNDRNIIVPILPESVFTNLVNAPNRVGRYDKFDLTKISKMTYLSQNKLFVRLNYQLLKILCSNKSLNPTSKILWLDLFISFYKASFSKNFDNSLVISYKELAERHQISSKTIAKYMALLADSGFIVKEKIFYKNQELASESFRVDLVCWKISLLNEGRAIAFEHKTSNLVDKCTKNHDSKSPILDHAFSYSGLPINKDNKKEYKDRSIKSNFESSTLELDSLQSKQIQQEASKFSKTKNISNLLNDFYPLTKQDCSLLQSKSGRDFSLNAMNEILKDMANRLKNRAFHNKKAFLAYMGKALTYEMRDAVKTANESFKIKNNANKQEVQERHIEEYLSEIESSLAVSPEMHFKKKICSTLEPKSAYEFLRSYQYSKIEKDIFKIFLNQEVPIAKHEQEIIKNQAKATHESLNLRTGEIVTIKNIEIIIKDQSFKLHKTEIGRGSNDFVKDNKEEIPENINIWSRARLELAEIYGSAIDKNWFAKLKPEINEEKKEIKLIAPSDFFKEWIDRNYKTKMDFLLKQDNYNCLLGGPVHMIV